MVWGKRASTVYYCIPDSAIILDRRRGILLFSLGGAEGILPRKTTKRVPHDKSVTLKKPLKKSGPCMGGCRIKTARPAARRVTELEVGSVERPFDFFSPCVCASVLFTDWE